MGIRKLLDSRKLAFSFEVFPPKDDSSVATIYKALCNMGHLSPDFISVTYSAGGAGNARSTVDLSSYIQEKLLVPALSHITCIGSSKEEIIKTVGDLKSRGIYDVLALRGDRRPDIPPREDFLYACDLVRFLKKIAPELDVAVAGYPEKHPESASVDDDIEHLKEKVDSGADNIITQLFFDNNYFYDFLNKIRKKQISVPVQAGIMPVVNKKQVERIVSMCGATFPAKFRGIVEKYERDDAALFDAGVAYATEQITSLIASGVDGIHLYTMNNPKVAAAIVGNVKNLVAFENKTEATS